MKRTAKSIVAIMLVCTMTLGLFLVMPIMASSVLNNDAPKAAEINSGAASIQEAQVPLAGLPDGAAVATKKAFYPEPKPVSIAPATSGIMALDASLNESPFTTYTIVDPGNGENGVDILTWEQIQSKTSADWYITIGDTVNIHTTASPTKPIRIWFYNGIFDTTNDDPPIGVVSTVTGVPGVTYENLMIATSGDTTIQDLSILCSFDNALEFVGVARASNPEHFYSLNYYYHNYDATLTVIGDCSLKSTYWFSMAPTSAMALNEYTVKNLTISGSGTLQCIGIMWGITFNYAEYDPARMESPYTLTVNVPLIAEANGNSGSRAGIKTRSYCSIPGNSPFLGSMIITGSSSLEVKSVDPTASGSRGMGIEYIQGYSLTFSGDLDMRCIGSGSGHGITIVQNVTDGANIPISRLFFDLAKDAYFEGGETGAGYGTPSGNATIITNTNQGNVIFHGGMTQGDGILLQNDLSLVNSGTGRFIISGGGNGNGICMPNGKTLDITGLNYDLVLRGGEAAPLSNSSNDRRLSSGLYLGSDRPTIILGNNNLLCYGGPNGGAGITSYIYFTIESTGGEIYSFGGKGINGYGLWTPGTTQGTFSVRGNGTMNLYGSYNHAGAFGFANIDLDGAITLNVTGGARARGIFGDPLVRFLNGNAIVAVTNNSSANEIHRFTSSTPGAWNLTDATFTSGNESSANVSVSVAPGKTGIITR